jgi:radical SAM protein with 4Fe4S-binding SPASM domain
MKFFIPQWIATRHYKSGSGSKSIVTNDLDHEIITFDNESAELWTFMVEETDSNGAFDIDIILNKFPVPVDEIKNFIEALFEANLINYGSVKEKASEVDFTLRKNRIIPSQKYAEGSSFEPAPGGTNLQVEGEILEYAADNGYLYGATWEITYRCNESCVHCFNPGASHSAAEKPKRKTEELTTEEAYDFLLDIKKSGVFRLLITGGEVFLRKDIFEIIAFAKKNRFSVTLFTNGVLLDEEKIKKLRDLFVTRIEMSIYSSKPEFHDSITRLKNSYLDTFKAAEMMVNVGLNVAIKMISMKETINHADDFLKICNEIGVEGQVDFNMSPGVDGSNFPTTNLIPSPLDLIKKSLDPKTSLFVGDVSKPRKFDPKKLVGQRVCGAGVTLLSISPEGHIYPCNSLPIQIGNLRNESLSSVWAESDVGSLSKSGISNDRLSQWQSVKRGDYDVCGNYDRCGWCQKCPGMAFLETGSELAPSIINCRNSAARMIAHNLLQSFGDNAVLNIDEDKLRKEYPEESALWNTSAVQNTISLEKVKQILKDRTKAKALQ